MVFAAPEIATKRDRGYLFPLLNPHTGQPANVQGGGVPAKPATRVDGGNQIEACKHARNARKEEASRKYRQRVKAA